MGSKRKRNAKNDGQTAKRPRNATEESAVAAPASLQLDKSPFSEKVTTEDRKREARIYELLGSADGTGRIAAADALITGRVESTEPVLERHLEKRLFRGLASSRNASRLGFSLVLTEVLNQLFGPKNLAKARFSGLTFNKVLDILREKTESGGNIPGQEERDFCFGQLFGLQCFVESKVLFGECDDDSRWPQVLDMLLKLANKKVWLRSQCAWVIVETLPQMGQGKAGETIKQLVDVGLGKTAEGVGIWLKTADCYPDLKMPTKPWSGPLAPKSLTELANVLKENVKQDNNGTEASSMVAKQGHFNPQLHFVWDLILDHFLESRDADHLKLFWNTVVDDALFSKNASDVQKFRGFSIFRKYIQGLAAKKEQQLLKELFSRKLMASLMNQAYKQDRYLHHAAVKSLKVIEATVEAEPTYLVPVLKELLGQHGGYNFDQRTSSKTIDRLLQFATPENNTTILHMLRDPVAVIADQDAPEVEKLRHVYADYVFKLGIHPTTPSETAIHEMAKCAYSKCDGFKPPLSEKTREIFRGKLASTFARLAKRREEYRYLCEAILSVDPSAVQMDEEIETQRKAALKNLRKLLKIGKGAEKEESGSSLGLALLYAVTLVQLFDGDRDAMATLEDLKQFSEKMKEADDAVPSLLVEILLALASRPSPLTRQVTQQVFEAFTGQLSADALQLLTDPLAVEESLKGQQALFDAEDEEMEDADGTDESDDDVEEDDVSEIGSDVEFVTLNGAEAGDDDEHDSDPGDEDGGDQGDGENKPDAEAMAGLDDALAQVLKSHRLDQDKEAESDNESDMTDSEMMALDEKLVEVFKHRANKPNKRKEGKDAKETVVTFKHRLLDFLHIYVKKEALNPLAFRLLVPLLELVRTTQTKPLAQKAVKIIMDFAEAFKKGKSKAEELKIDIESQLALLREIHEEAPKDFSHAFAAAASAASQLVASSLLAADKSTAGRVNELYAELLTKRMLGQVKVQHSFFSDWLNWGQGHAVARG